MRIFSKGVSFWASPLMRAGLSGQRNVHTFMARLSPKPARPTQLYASLAALSNRPGKPDSVSDQHENPHAKDQVDRHQHRFLHSHSHGAGAGHGHNHNHSHSVTGELLSTGQLSDPAVRITLVGFLTNVGMAVTKYVGGVVFNSQSLIADAIHALSDLVSDILTLSTVSVARKPPSVQFPNGYGRIEAVGAFGVSSLLLVAGLSMGWGSIVQIASSLGVSTHIPILGSLLGHAHTHAQPAEWSAAGIALASIVIKEALYQATRRVAERQNSPVLFANAWHHRIDSLVSVVAVVSISAGQILQTAWLDPLGGLVVSAMIVRAGWRPAVDAALELCGSAKPALDSPTFIEFQNRAKDELALLAPGYEIVRCTLEPYGSTFVGSVQITNVGPGAEEVAQKLRSSLLEIDHMRQVYIRI